MYSDQSQYKETHVCVTDNPFVKGLVVPSKRASSMSLDADVEAAVGHL